MPDRIVAKVRASKDYGKFQVFIGNRGIEPRHIKNLVESMEGHGWINSLPVTVKANGSGKLQLLDGHTRFLAAKDLGIPIQYVEVETGTDDFEEILLINGSQRSWSGKDYAVAYANMGKKDYKVLVEFMKKYKIGLTIAAALLGAGTWHISTIREGKFKVADEGWATECLGYLNRINVAIPFSAKRNKFVVAFIRAMFVDEFEPERFVEQVTKYPQRVKDFSNQSDIAQMFEDLYNFRRGTKNKIPLAFAMEQIRRGM